MITFFQFTTYKSSTNEDIGMKPSTNIDLKVAPNIVEIIV